VVQFITGNCYKSELHFRNIRVSSNELNMCARFHRMILVENTRSTGAEVAGVQKSRRNNGFKDSYSFSANSSAKDWSGYPVLLYYLTTIT